MKLFKIVTLKDRASMLVSPKSKFYKIYTKGEELIDETESLGFFCFKDKEYAKNYLQSLHSNMSDLINGPGMIIRVEGFGDIIKPLFISNTARNLAKFYKLKNKGNSFNSTNLTPIGSICCKHIKIIT